MIEGIIVLAITVAGLLCFVLGYQTGKKRGYCIGHIFGHQEGVKVGREQYANEAYRNKLNR